MCQRHNTLDTRAYMLSTHFCLHATAMVQAARFGQSWCRTRSIVAALT
jgi:hypothetical protein